MSSHTSASVQLDPVFHQRLHQALAEPKSHYATAYAEFLRRHPQIEAYESDFEALRKTDYARLDAQGHIYLDYTGGGLYAQSQIDHHSQYLAQDIFGNPHSSNPTSMAATQHVDSARAFVYEYFNADPAEYVVIFTSNASAALKLLGESYPFEAQGQYLLTFDNHNSVNGIREYAIYYQAPVTYAPIILPDMLLNGDALRDLLKTPIAGGNNLFAFPAQSNFSGVQHPLTWIAEAQEYGWDVLVDCAAFVPTNRLDLGHWKPDFVPVSFYKMFGYPTGLGALLVKRNKLSKLRRPWFAGGTVEIVSTITSKFIRAASEAAFEDGTIDYLGIPAVEIGLRHLQQVGIERIHARTEAFTDYLLGIMNGLMHSNGEPLIHIYGPTENEGRGGTIAFNLLDPHGEIFDVQLVEALANEARISLRTGCFCNPGAGEHAFELSAEVIEACSADPDITFERYIAALTAHTHRNLSGAIRVSVGIVTDFNDLYQFTNFLHTFLDMPSPGFIARKN